MKSGIILKASFIISNLFFIAGAYMKMFHLNGTDKFFITGIIAAILFMATAIYEIRTSKQINNYAKTKWTIALLLFTGIAGIIYFFIERKRVAENARN